MEFQVILSNAGGELDRRTASSVAQAASVARQLILEAGELHPGDTLKVIAPEATATAA